MHHHLNFSSSMVSKNILLDFHKRTISFNSMAQSVTCLATDVCLTADPGVASLIPARSHTIKVIDHEIISMVKRGCFQVQAKVCARSTG